MMTRLAFRSAAWALTYTLTTTLVQGLRFNPTEVDYNLNQNRTAQHPLDYWGEREGHTYTQSPENWRFPFYTLFLDRFVNGDPSNDNANGTLFEYDMLSNQLRHGGDLQGLIDSLDYIQGMGVKGLYIAGSIFINQPWGADSYSPLDLTLLDKHFGDITMWQTAIDEVHKRGMWVVLDQTMATMGDLIGFKGYLNDSTPFSTNEHEVEWKSSRRYLDFDISNEYNDTCEYPRFWFEDGFPVAENVTKELKGCYNSDFDQYGDIEAFGVHPDWQRQMAKFASVQDRLREWVPSVMARLQRFSCMTIAMLDIDGFRIDKAVQVTVDAQAEYSTAMRECARKYGKDNFMVVGEITSGNGLGSIYLGRGRQPDMKPDLAQAMKLEPNSSSDSQYFLRGDGMSALDAGAFHYSIYRFMTRFLGLSGNLEAGFDLPLDWVEAWNEMVQTNDFYNANTGKFDPRHLYGVTNQDVFRWPAIKYGTERMLLGYFITTLTLPGAPLVYYGEEQELYVLDNTAENYVFGRQAFSPAQAWRAHGCYAGDNQVYKNWPVEKARTGCLDESVGYDHRDPSAPVRNIMKHMFALREKLPVLEHGWKLEKLANQTEYILLNGSTSATEFGIWSVARAMYTDNDIQAENGTAVWLVYHNRENRTTYEFDCSSDANRVAFISPFDANTEVRNLFSQDDAITLETSAKLNNFTGTGQAGCISSITLEPFEFRAYVPKEYWVETEPMITKFEPGHDYPIDSTSAGGQLNVSLHFSVEMDCDSITKAVTILSTTVDGTGNDTSATFSSDPVCGTLENDEKLSVTGAIASVYYWNATLSNLVDGVHQLVVTKPLAKSGASTNTTDRFLIRFGKRDNPIVFPTSANYSRSLLTTDDNDNMYVNHAAAGATKWRYSSNWGSTWSNWISYTDSSKVRIVPQGWKGSSRQEWEGVHIMVQYYSAPLGSSAFIQHGDVSKSGLARRFPHVFLHGPFNRWGFDAGILNTMSLTADSTWEMHFMYEWPAQFQVNIWGINPDSQPDVSFIYGDVNKDGILDRLPPSSLTQNVVNMTDPPAWPALSYKIVLNDALWKVEALPQGHVWIQILLFFLLAIVPVGLAGLAGWTYVGSFYQVKINKSGLSKKGWLPLKFSNISSMSIMSTAKPVEMSAITPTLAVTPGANPITGGNGGRRTVLIATMEYNIDDWNISIKIGGLGVMAKLMSAALPHLDVVWVVPCVGDVEYPIDQPAESMFVKTMGQSHEVQVQYHHYQNITYVILDAPIFRAQTKADPYISRMDDIESAILYTAWNSCIAETIRRFPIDIYHINDYHGAAAPLYLLPQTIPCCLSLHNAEFQGMWPMRTPEEQKEVCDVFNLPLDVVKEYVQYGSVFNLLHAGASYLRVHQRGFGAVGVSKKYGDRSLARYPIFWSLKNIGQLPNPDPSDKDDWDPNQDAASNLQDIKVDQAFEQSRADLRRQAQEWAGLEVNPNAELFVFVGRWSLQKGVDLIADIFPSILEKYPTVQLICVGPVIDLYGKFAALKLEKLVAKYPKRVFSKPEFTALPPYIFSGAEFALIPSRDEPFGLVAVEFGRKGALGVGARVGGLGQMPGFWYTVESTSPSHLLHQFKQAIVSALEAKTEKRALMRAWSAKQRFPVAKWVQELDKLHSESIRIHNKEEGRRKKAAGRSLMRPSLRASTAIGTYKNDGGIASPGAESPVISTPGRVASPLLRFDSPGLGTPTAPWTHIDSSPRSSIASTLGPGYASNNASSLSVDSLAFRVQNPGPGESGLGLELPPPNTNGFYQMQGNSSQLSLPDVVGDRHDLKLQKVDLFFTDSNGEFYSEFEEMLEGLTAKNSATDLCIESFLKKSEKDWFARYRDAKLGRSRDSSRTRSPAPSRPQSRNGDSRDASVVSRGRQRMRSTTPSRLASVYTMGSDPTPPNSTMYLDDEFMLGDEYQAPTGLKKFLSIRIGDWPIYSFLLAFGQVISINSYQIVLLTGETSQTPAKLYIVASTYLAMSIVWWFLVRNFKSVYALSAPWIFFGLAFLFIGIAPLIRDGHARGAVQDVATALYAAGASHGALAFALNFGDEGGSPTRQWITRALAVSGVAQAYALALWYWGSLVGKAEASPVGFVGSSSIPKALLICVPIAILLWGVGLILFLGLPDYYRQSPETIPGFYISLARRKIVGWFFVMIIIQNYWLSAPYGRNWAFLFSSQFIPGWAVFLLALGFILGLWSIILYGFSLFSESHTWLLPIFAIGLAAPRWAQMLWGVSGIGMYLPWVASPVGGAVLSRCLWLWLGLLDAIQGVGLGMMLLATLTRMHVLAVLVGAQVVGSAFTMLAQATSPNAFHASTTFPDFSQGLLPGIGQAWFWICLAFQLVIPLGFFKFFRKEQVAKP